MKIFQPMLFVGLGGTGGLVGAELERRLRAELCGPDGTALTADGRRLPHQLPDCVQFVYADYSEAELAKLPHLSADPALRQAYSRTARATHDLLPAEFDSSPEVTQMLRAVLRTEVADWLPTVDDEPKVTPLRSGAGQLPTVGRAALFATLRDGPAPVLDPLRRAIDAIGLSGGELSELGGGPLNGCDVFVAFSVAGGTGAGIFLDYLYLIGQVFKEKGLPVRVYPFVVMPKAFPPGKGGGRRAELNAARAVVDLSRLVDEQNVPDPKANLGDTGRPDPTAMRYPQMHPVRLRTGTVPTAFLFSPTAGIRPDDLRRSMVSLVMSLIGTDLGDSARGTDHDDQTFSSNFINAEVDRRIRSATGIGHRGISTSLVASMTSPLDELAELVAARMLALAVRRITDTAAHTSLDVRALTHEMFTAAGIAPVWRREALPVPDPDPVPKGTSEIQQALRDRLEEMQRLLGDLETSLTHQAPKLADAFAPQVAAEQLLRKVDLLSLKAVVKGVPGQPGAVGLGFLGMLENRRQEPARPAGVDVQPPSVPRIHRRAGGLHRAHWGDEEVRAALEEQNLWYEWRAKVVWHRAWDAQEPRWRRKAEDLRHDIGRLAEAFDKHLEEEPRAWAAGLKELYDDRAGVSYLLPPQNSLRDFYEDLIDRLVESAQLGRGGDEADLLTHLVSADCWEAAFTAGRRNPAAAVAEIKTVLQKRVEQLFAEPGAQQRAQPLLPSMGTLLSAAAGDGQAAHDVSRPALDQFTYKLAGLLPAAFTPEGNGPLKILITYPSTHGRRTVLEDYLEKALHLPKGRRSIVFRPVDTDSITVVLFRSEMSLTEVPGAREVMRQWARAQENRRDDDVLRWRQRLGYQDDWLACTPDDRRHILQRLLCVIWNGRVDVQGDPGSPRRVTLRLHDEMGPEAPGLTLRLDEHQDGVSGWASLLRAYERWALLEEDAIVEDYCRVLMDTLPNALGTSGSRPSPLYLKLVHEVAPRQLELLAERERMYGGRIAEWLRPLREFWSVSLPGALDLAFPNEERAVQSTLRTLEEWTRIGSRPAAPEAASPPRREHPGGATPPGGPSDRAPQPGVVAPREPWSPWRRPAPAEAESGAPQWPGAADDRTGTVAAAAPVNGRSRGPTPPAEAPGAMAAGPGHPFGVPADGYPYPHPGAMSDGSPYPHPAGPGGTADDAPPRPGAAARPGHDTARQGRSGSPLGGAQVPTAGRTVPVAEQPAGYPPYPDRTPADPPWPGGDTSVPWGIADSDGQDEWDDTGEHDPWKGDPR
ncbi:tubulin-like doman-containing protein [Streptomyces rishiriensis]|uniref:tubulin-like doman-containing protein n=1 Tax=Streptomyces rishiriensis TaxID=68264 RepID=UPI00379BF233